VSGRLELQIVNFELVKAFSLNSFPYANCWATVTVLRLVINSDTMFAVLENGVADHLLDLLKSLGKDIVVAIIPTLKY
jgi:hypothetical protein